MVYPQIKQPATTYLQWKRFSYPHPDHGPIPAFAVSESWSRYIQSAYTIMATLVVVNITSIFVAGGLWIYLRGPRRGNRVNDISISLWNRRDATHMAVVDTWYYSRDAFKKWWYYPLMAILLGAWISSTLAGILLPPTVVLGHAAPVNASSIYVPPNLNLDTTTASLDEILKVHVLDTEPYLRAAGAAYIAGEEIRGKVMVTMPVKMGTWTEKARLNLTNPRSETIHRIEYGYQVTGADFGLQKLPKLRLTVSGACTTDYDWYRGQKKTTGVEMYQSPWREEGKLEQITASCPPPLPFFKSEKPIEPAFKRGNTSWAIIISSFNRTSRTPSEDPWYRTTPSGDPDLPHVVLPGRPVLTCWETNMWSWGDPVQSGTLLDLRAKVGKELLSDALFEILQRYFMLPVAYNFGFALQSTALQSAKNTVGRNFDAGSSSIYKDLRYIFLGAYIATVNTLTDTTLLQTTVTGENRTIHLPNIARDKTTQEIRPGVDEFVVFSSQVVTLSLTTAVLIPVLTLGSWLLMHMMLGLTPLRMAAAMESIELFQAVKQQYGEPTVHLADNGTPHWKFSTDHKKSLPSSSPNLEAAEGVHVVTPRVNKPLLFDRNTDENATLYDERRGSIMDVDSLYQYEDDPQEDPRGEQRNVSLSEVPLLDLSTQRGQIRDGDGDVREGSQTRS